MATLHTLDTAPESSREILRNLHAGQGTIMNFFALVAESPEVLKAYMDLMGVTNKFSMTSTEKQVINLTTNYENNCEDCMPIYTAIARGVGVPEAVIQSIRNNDLIADQRLQALRQLVSDIVRNRAAVAKKTLEEFYSAGYSDTQLMEIVVLIATKTISNYMAHLFELPVDEMFKDDAWGKPEPH